jgi:hypothetical protein
MIMLYSTSQKTRSVLSEVRTVACAVRHVNMDLWSSVSETILVSIIKC